MTAQTGKSDLVKAIQNPSRSFHGAETNVVDALRKFISSFILQHFLGALNYPLQARFLKSKTQLSSKYVWAALLQMAEDQQATLK